MLRRGGDCPAAGVDAGVGPGGGGVLHDARQDELRVSIEIALLDHHLHQRITIAAGESAAEIVERQTELAVAANGATLARAGVEGEIAAIDGEGRGLGKTQILDLPAAQSSRDVDPAVGGERRMIRAELFVERGETLVPRLFLVGPTVAIVVGEVSNLARERHERA